MAFMLQRDVALDGLRLRLRDACHEPVGKELDHVGMPAIRLGASAPHEVARTLAAGGADLVDHPEVLPVDLFQLLARGARKVGGYLMVGLHDLGRTGHVEEKPGAATGLIDREQHLHAIVFAFKHADEVRPVRIAIHLRRAVGIARETAVPDAGLSVRPANAAALSALPCRDIRLHDAFQGELRIFVGTPDIRLLLRHLLRPWRPGRTDSRRAVRMDAPHVDAFRGDLRQQLMHTVADTLDERLPYRHVVEPAHEHMLVAALQHRRDKLDAAVIGIFAVRKPQIVLPAQRDFLRRWRRNIHLVPTDLKGVGRFRPHSRHAYRTCRNQQMHRRFSERICFHAEDDNTSRRSNQCFAVSKNRGGYSRQPFPLGNTIPLWYNDRKIIMIEG